MLKLTSFNWDHGKKREYFGDAPELEAILKKLYPDIVQPHTSLSEMVQAINSTQIYSVRVDKIEENNLLPPDYASHFDNPPDDPWVREADIKEDD